MRKRLISILLITLTFSCMLFGCDKVQNNSDASVIVDGTFKIGALLPSNESATEDIQAGLDYAYNLASSVNIYESVDVDFTKVYYNDSNDVEKFAENLVADGNSAIIYYGDNLETFTVFAEYIRKTEIPVISLSPYTSESDNIFSISLNPKYMSSCTATYAMENNYKNCAVLLESSEKYYSDFAEAYKNTLKSYIGTEPTVYYKNGKLANYSPSALSSGNYDYLFLVSTQNSREELITELRTNGYFGEIMLTEVIDKASVKSDVFNNCSLISKLEADINNNVSTVFYSMFAEYCGINEADVSPASAYGYDAYMTAFEALKSFAPKGGNSIFASSNATSASIEAVITEIKLSDFCKAIENVTYFGVTDIIKFSDNSAVPTYIYVDNIIDADVLFGNKYTFASNTTAE